MNGFPVALIKNQGCAPILDAIAHIGRNLVRVSKREWYEATRFGQMDVGHYEPR